MTAMMRPISDEEQQLTTLQACELLDCGRSHFFNVVLKKGLLTPIRFGARRIRFRRLEVARLRSKGYNS
jgi:predicted DNA-binding transcriptional regulator AlpA